MVLGELELNRIYTCVLSGVNMLIVSKTITVNFKFEKTVVVKGRYYNAVSGRFEEVEIKDYQLK